MRGRRVVEVVKEKGSASPEAKRPVTFFIFVFFNLLKREKKSRALALLSLAFKRSTFDHEGSHSARRLGERRGKKRRRDRDTNGAVRFSIVFDLSCAPPPRSLSRALSLASAPLSLARALSPAPRSLSPRESGAGPLSRPRPAALSFASLSSSSPLSPSLFSLRRQVDGALVSSIGRGILVLVGVAHGDGPADVDWVARKLLSARLFPSPSSSSPGGDGGAEEGEGGAAPPRWSASVSDLPDGEILCVSQFTLLGSLKKGTKPDFKAAAAPAEALETYRALLDRVREGFKEPGRVKDGVFGAMMKVRGGLDWRG